MKRTFSFVGTVAFPIALLSPVTSCSNITETGIVPAQAFPVEHLNGQLAPVGTTLIDSIGVQVIDALGKPLAGIPVSWERIEGNGRVEPEATLTDASGIARAAWKLDTVAGLMHAQATVQGLSAPVRIDARALPGSVTRLAIVDGTISDLGVGRTLALTTERRDGYGNVVTEATPAWSTLDATIAVVSSGGIVTGVSPGIARIRAHQEAGSDTVSIRVVASAGGGWIDADVGGSGVGGHSCAIADGGRAHCWGYNDGGQLGTGNIVPQNRPTPVTQPPGVRFTKIRAGSGGSKVTCALTDTGDVYCWGESAVGNGAAFSRVPVRVATPPSEVFIDIDVGRDHACSISTANAVFCWGSNAFGQIGNGTRTTAATPVAIASTIRARTLSLSAESSCAVSLSGDVYCWGRGASGELATGDTVSLTQPARVNTLSNIASMFSGAEHRCAISVDGRMWCWGKNDFGQVRGAAGAVGGNILVATPVSPPGAELYAIGSAGLSHSCVAVQSRAIYCWGANESGQLGTGDTRDSPTLRVVSMPANVTVQGLTHSASFGCVLTTARELYCWGSDSQGQLGNGSLPGSALPIRIDPPQ